jgi:hypothetical protein
MPDDILKSNDKIKDLKVLNFETLAYDSYHGKIIYKTLQYLLWGGGANTHVIPH